MKGKLTWGAEDPSIYERVDRFLMSVAPFRLPHFSGFDSHRRSPGENTGKGLLNPTLNTKNKGSLFTPHPKVRNFFLSSRSKQGRCTGNKYCHMGINYCRQLSLKYSDNAPTFPLEESDKLHGRRPMEIILTIFNHYIHTTSYSTVITKVIWSREGPETTYAI